MSHAWRVDRIRKSINLLGISYDFQAPERLADYYELLVAWNARMNLTGETDFETVLSRHYMDCLAPLSIKNVFPQGMRMVDVGSGAGFPGLLLAIARPDAQVLLLDSLAKRVTFLNEGIRTLGLKNVRALHARAEDAAHRNDFREHFDVAVARAVAGLPVLCELLLPFVRVGGHMACYKGPSAFQEKEAGGLAAVLVGGEPLQFFSVEIPEQPDWQHVVVVGGKRMSTSAKYPRKAGIPARSPLGMQVPGQKA